MLKIKKRPMWPIALVAGALITPFVWAQSAPLALTDPAASSQPTTRFWTLKTVFEQAWALQPEASSIDLRRDAASAAAAAATGTAVARAAAAAAAAGSAASAADRRLPMERDGKGRGRGEGDWVQRACSSIAFRLD